MDRRTIIKAATCCGSLAAMGRVGPALSARLPLCRYSPDDGWSNEAGKKIMTRTSRENDPSGIPQAVARIKKALGFSNRIDVFIAKEDNVEVFATVAQSQRLLVADEAFLTSVNRKTGTNWAAIQVIAHEVGHHVAGFIDDAHSCELNADYWSGQALQRLGSSQEVAASAIMALGLDWDTESHPNRRRRAEVILRGWSDSSQGVIDYSHCQACRG